MGNTELEIARREIKSLKEHIEKLYTQLEEWQKVAEDKDRIIETYQSMVN